MCTDVDLFSPGKLSNLVIKVLIGERNSGTNQKKSDAGIEFLNLPLSKLSRPAKVVFADDAVTDAAKLMLNKATGSVLVAENAKTKDEPIGILTEWDLLSKVVAAEKDATRIRAVMSSPVQKN